MTGAYKTLLIVDDDNDTRDFLESLLETQGFNVVLAEDGVNALSIYDENSDSIDAVITDVKMPKMTGIELTRELLKKNKNLPVYVISGGDYKNEAINAGAKEFISRGNLSDVCLLFKKKSNPKPFS